MRWDAIRDADHATRIDRITTHATADRQGEVLRMVADLLAAEDRPEGTCAGANAAYGSVTAIMAPR
jgi:hypothetical protein